MIFQNNENSIIFDSGCTRTIVTNRNLITNLVLKRTGKFTLPDGTILEGSGTGNIILNLKHSKIIIPCIWLPQIKQNLISINDINELGYDLQFSSKELKIKTHHQSKYNEIIATMDKHTGLFTHILENTHDTKHLPEDDNQVLVKNSNLFQDSQENFGSTNIKDKQWIMQLAQRKLPDLGDTREINNTDNPLFNLHVSTNHFSIKALKRLIKAKGLKIKTDKKLCDAVKACKICQLVNHEQISHNKTTQKPPTRVLERVHSDTMGPFYIRNNKFYLTTIIDHFSRYTNIVFKQSKDLQDEIIKRLKIWNNKFTQNKIAFYRADNAPELPSKEQIEQLGADREIIAPYSPQVNGLAESHNHIIIRNIRKVVLNFPYYQIELMNLLSFIINYAVHIKNHTPNTQGLTPFEIFYNTSYRINYQPFGIDVNFKLLNAQEAKKFKYQFQKQDVPIISGFFLGYCDDSNAFLVRAKTADDKYIDSIVMNVKFLNTMNNIDKYLETFKLFKNDDNIHNLKQLQQFFQHKLVYEQDTLPEIDNNSNDTPITDFQKLKEKYPEIIEDFNTRVKTGKALSNNNPMMNQQSKGINHHFESGGVDVPKVQWSELGKDSSLTEDVMGLKDTSTSANLVLSRCTNIQRDNGIRSTPSFSKDEKLMIQTPTAINTDHNNNNELLIMDSNLKVLSTPIHNKYRSRYGNKYGSGIFDRDINSIKKELKNFKNTISYNTSSDLSTNLINLSLSANESNNINSIMSKKRRRQTVNAPNIKKIKSNNNFQLNNVLNISSNLNQRFFPPPRQSLDQILAINLQDYNFNINTVVEKVDDNDKNWQQARIREIDKLKHNHVFEPVKKKKGMKVIPTRFVYTFKQNNPKGEQYKARFVVKGYAQQQFVNYDPNRISSPVTDITSIKLLTTIAAQKGFIISHLDVKLAYLNASLEEEIYIKPPKEMDFPSDQVWKLSRALYGLRQSALAWYLCIKQIFNNLGFDECLSNPCIFTNKDFNNQIIIAIYVDDIFVLTKDKYSYEKFYDQLSQKVELSQQGPVAEYLGIEFTKTEYGYTLSQKKYVEEILRKFTPENDNIQKSIPRPVRGQKLLLSEKFNNFEPDTSFKFDHNRVPQVPDHFYHDDEDQDDPPSPKLDDEGKELYQSVLGSLLWLAQNTRPEISFAVNALGAKNHQPNLNDYQFMLYLLAYLRKNPFMELRYEKDTLISSNKFMIHGFLDASYAPQKTRASISGNCIFVNGNLISWLTKRQRIITTSSKTCELYALGTAVNLAFRIKELLEDLDQQTGKITIFEDNQAVIYNIYGKKMNCSRRSIDIIMKHLRQEVLDFKTLSIPYIKTQFNIADLFTKPLTKIPFTKLTNMLYNEAGLNYEEILKAVKDLNSSHCIFPLDQVNNITQQYAIINNQSQSDS